MRVVTTDLEFPEGPVAMADGSVIVCEIPRGTLTRVHSDGRRTVVAKLGGSPCGAARGPDGRLYVCNNGGMEWIRDGNLMRPTGHTPADYRGGLIQVVDPETGKCETLYDRIGEHRLSSPNDIVFDATGGFYFTDHGKHHARSLDRGGIYWARADGSEIREVIYPVPFPNGIGLSPDSRTLYAAETPGAKLMAWEIVGPGKVAMLPFSATAGARIVGQAPAPARFDSLAVAASGKICVATLNVGGITEIWPDGSHVQQHFLPDLYTTNLCFGGADMRRCYVTLAQSGLLVELLWHEAGLLLNYQERT